MAQISVKLSADIRSLERALKAAERRFKQFEEAAEKAREEAEKPTKDPFKKTKKGAENTVPTLLEFNRVIQDAPFGIQGVANNLTQLVQNFGDLRRSAGGTRAALSSLVAGFAGPAGILFVVSAATSLLVAFGDKLGKSADKAKELKDRIEQVNASFDIQLKRSELLEESLKLQEKSTLGILSARQEIYRQQLLTLSALIQEQQEQLNTQILENKRLSGLEAIKGVISETVDQLKISLGITELIDKALIQLAATNAVLLGLEADKVKASAASAEDKKKEAELAQQLGELENQRLSVINEIAKLQKEITTAKQAEITASIKPAPIRTGIFDAVNQIPGVVGPTFAAVTATANRELSKFELRLRQFEETSSGIIQGGILDGFSALGNGIADALLGADNALEGFANSIFAALGNFLTQLGQAAIATGIGMLGLKNAFANPLAAIAAGTALVAAGALLSKASASAPGGGLTGVGGGGFNSGGGGTFTGASSSVSTSGGFGGTVVFEIQGTKLVGVLNRTLKKDRRSVADII